ncbi:transposase family protein [Streptomyces sp. NPDC052236]|uniref:transposase family protein n=1 Tax=Streptomyces sp. NPDC052236 TaxID=3365686 RepID=UPI0037D10FD1
MVVESVERTSRVVTFRTSCRTLPVRCPRCTLPSWRVHGRYLRRMADAPLGITPVVIELLVRRFKCTTYRDGIPRWPASPSRGTPVTPDEPHHRSRSVSVKASPTNRQS